MAKAKSNYNSLLKEIRQLVEQARHNVARSINTELLLALAVLYVKDGTIKNLMIEITGMSKEKSEKKLFVENRWLPVLNALKEKYEYPEWHFIEIANDIRNIKNQLAEKIASL